MSSSENESSPVKGKRKNPVLSSATKPSIKRINVNNTTSFDNEEEKDHVSDDNYNSEDEEEFVKTKRKAPIRKESSNSLSKKISKKDNDGDAYSDCELVLSDDDNNDSDDDDKIKPMEAGQISKVYCENFMCHKKMSVAFGKHVTFVTGQNGSGKSAIAAAIQLCLGATTKSTGRGSSMSNLIREGSTQGYAIVSVTLINVGTDAFKPDLYGQKIRIERKIPKAGGAAGYKLFACDKNGRYDKLKCVSQDKKELMAMLAHFNIYVDNPTVVLTQEESKKFIQGQEKEKYAFFLKATGLERINLELTECIEQLKGVTETLKKQEGRLEEKAIERNKIKDELQQLIELDTYDAKIGLCLAKKYWLQVMQYNSEVIRYKNEYDEKENDVRLADENLKKAEENQLKAESSEELIEKSKILQEDKNKYENEIEEKLQQVNNVRKKIIKVQNELSALNKSKSDFSSRLIQRKESIKVLQQRAIATSEGQEREIMEKIAGYNDKIQELKNQEEQLNNQKNEINDKIESHTREYQHHQQQQNQVVKEIQKLEDNLRNVSNSSGGRVAMFGKEMPDIVKAIDINQFSDRVYAPLGLSFKVKEEYSKNGWNHALEKGIGGTCSSIVVTNSEDQKKMRTILERLNCASKYSIIRQNKSSKHNVRPINGQLTVLDALIVENDPDNVIFNTLIDHIKAETKVLIEEENSNVISKYIEKDQKNRDILKYGAKILISKSATTIKYVNGNQAFERERNQMKNYLVADMKDVLNNLKNDINAQKRNLDELRSNNNNDLEISSLHHTIKNITEHMKKINMEIKKINAQKSDANRKLSDIQEAGKIDTTDLELEVVELENAIVRINDQEEIQISKIEDYENEVKDIQKEKKSIEKEKIKIISQIDANDAHVEEIFNRAKERQSKIIECKKKLEKAEKSFFDASAKKESTQETYDKLKEVAEIKTTDLVENWNREPLKLEKGITEKTIDTAIEKLKKQLDEGRRKAGLEGRTKESVQKKFEIVNHDFKMAKAEYKEVFELNKNLDVDVTQRKLNWVKQLKTQTKLVARRFDSYLQKKGFAGSVSFNHEEKKLNLICQTDNLDENSKSSDVRQLSGGERSFTTLSLLLALGHVIECPFRLMDEYDVFLDESSRAKTLQMLQDYALKPEQSNRQFIIITPHNLKGVTTSAQDTKIQKLQAPERGSSAHGLQQATLNF